ncbi:MAG: hypothetical protein WDN30_10980 [Pararobbsia sp.]
MQQALDRHGYVAERNLAATLLLTMEMRRPLLLEGEAASARPRSPRPSRACPNTRLIRLQCYEGLDVHSALYEWNYQRQLLAIKLLEQDDRPMPTRSRTSFPSAICSSARCSRRSRPAPRRCC